MIFLKRIASSNKGTFGVLCKDDMPLCVTLEDPWLDNAKFKSCIPEGVYECYPHNGQKYKNVWALKNVPGRNGVLIHSGNTIDDTSGCILVGRWFSEYRIVNSRNALDYLRCVLPDYFNLTITT